MAQDRVCNSCGGALNEDSKFCPACGTNVETPSDVECPSCGEKNAPDSKYCDQCGRFLTSEPKEESNIWVCEECKSENSDVSRYCETCGVEKVFPTNPPPESYDERWSRAFGSPGTDAGSSNCSGDSDESEDSNTSDFFYSIVGKIFYVVAAIAIIWGIIWGIQNLQMQEGLILLKNDEPPTSSTTSQQLAPVQSQPASNKEPVAPILFSDEQASSFLLKPDDFPKNWTAKRAGMFLDAKNDYLTDYNVKMIQITLEAHETEAAAQAAFSARKSEAQTTIDGRGISGDKLEDVKKYPLFVWNASQRANISGIEKWTVIGVYGNITVKVFHEGSMYAPKKNFAVDMAKKQIDRIKGD